MQPATLRVCSNQIPCAVQHIGNYHQPMDNRHFWPYNCLSRKGFRSMVPIWSYQELSGATWRYLEPPGAISSCLELSGAIWSSLELSGALWSYLQVSGAIWIFLELSGDICSCLELSETIWSYLELSAVIWSYLELSEAIWTRFRSHDLLPILRKFLFGFSRWGHTACKRRMPTERDRI